jgi:hypothetical protein
MQAPCGERRIINASLADDCAGICTIGPGSGLHVIVIDQVCGCTTGRDALQARYGEVALRNGQLPLTHA